MTESTDSLAQVVCDEVSRTFGTGSSAVVAVHGTSCTVPVGARITIAGPSGSGKSTLLHLMAGLERPTRGAVRWPGLPHLPAQRAREIGVVFQSPSLVPTLDVAENTGLPLVIAGVGRAEYTRRVIEALELVGIAELAAKLPEEISGGQAQRVAVARVLAQRPRLILADEPTGQLDHAAGRRLLDALLDAAEHLGAALVVTTHDRAVAERLDTHWTMHEGRLHTTVKGVVGS
jgi:putative ABC transport system ATP-binding protein